MSQASALIKVLENSPEDLASYLSAFPTQLILRRRLVKGTSGGANGRIEYEGYAPPDAPLTDAKWLIKKNIYDSNAFVTHVLFANGEAKFNKVFDDGSSNFNSYTYSES